MTSTSPEPPTTRRAPEARAEATGGRATTVLTVLCWVAIVVGALLRFVPRGDLWLDEALSVNIAGGPLGDITDALRRDGHPPLYYALLHLWTTIGGDGSWWVRALSGVIGIASIPVAALAGARVARRSGADVTARRAAGLVTAAVVALVPYGVRYGAEARMYALVILLVLVGYLAVDELVGSPSVERRWPDWLATTVVAACGAALLWTHYWSMWLLASVGLLALWRWWRASGLDADERTAQRRGSTLVVVGLVGAAVLFLPWAPALLYQSEHTGTPWGEAYRPTTLLLVTIVDFAGQAVAEPQLLSYVLVLLVVVALVGVVVRGDRGEVLQVEPRTTPLVRAEVVVVLVALGVGWAAGAVTGGTFHPRYAAVVFPLYCIAVAAGIGRLRGPAVAATAMAVLLVGSVASIGVEIQAPRTQAGPVADRIVADTGGDPSGVVVVACPDQLAPATERALRSRTGRDWRVVPFPAAGDPRFVDWVDYADRNESADPEEFLGRVVADLPEDTTVHYVFTPGYLTFDDKCERMASLLGEDRTLDVEINADGERYFENMGLWVFRPDR